MISHLKSKQATKLQYLIWFYLCSGQLVSPRRLRDAENLHCLWQTDSCWFINFTSKHKQMIWNSSRSVKSRYADVLLTMWCSAHSSRRKRKGHPSWRAISLFKVRKTRGRLENPSAFLASFANGHGSPWTPFDRLGHLDQCQRVLGKADTLLSRGEKGHFWLLFRHLISWRNTSICCQVHFSNG